MQTKKILVLLLLSSGTIAKMQAQAPTNNTQQYIEGAKVVVDILSLFKKQKTISNSTTTFYESKQSQKCNYCFLNSDTVQKIKVKLICKDTPADTIDLILKPNSKECSLGIKCGIYTCTVFDDKNNIINKGDILIDDKIGVKEK